MMEENEDTYQYSSNASDRGAILGAAALLFVEVIPISESASVELSAASAKLTLLELESRNGLGIQWDADLNANGPEKTSSLRKGFLFSRIHHTEEERSTPTPTILFPSEDPLVAQGIPCTVNGYATPAEGTDVIVTSGTLVRVLPALNLKASNRALEAMIGEIETPSAPELLEMEIVNNHNEDTIQQLLLRMSLQLSDPVLIGTTSDAFQLMERKRRRRQKLAVAIQRRLNSNRTQNQTSQLKSDIPPILRDGALLVHSPEHGSGKTALVEYVAKKLLNCSVVHKINPSALLARYGSQADIGLQAVLHSITMSAAVNPGSSICIILDHLDGMLPPVLSQRSSIGDASVAVLNAIASYLKSLLLSLGKRRQFPFPSGSPLYNINALHGSVLPVRLCVVAVVTCPDHGWRSSQQLNHKTGILDALPFGVYRLADLDTSTRLKAFRRAYENEGVTLTAQAQDLLQSFARSQLLVRGRLFSQVVSMTRHLMMQHGRSAAGIEEVEEAFVTLAGNSPGCSPLLKMDDFKHNEMVSLQNEKAFDSVGGTEKAKKALQDALLLDSTQRHLLDSWGIGFPVGLLFYGPPGCGKTLLAKAVSKLVGKASSSNAFIPLNSSEIVQAEVGTSEKLLVSAFLQARQNAPSVIFIDEFQALFTERSSSGSSKLSSTLLQCLDDIKLWRNADARARGNGEANLDDRTKRRVVVIGATNTPWMVDLAFLRPGRFDRIVHVGLPSEGDRQQILKVHMSKMKLLGGKASAEPYSRKLARSTAGLSGADLSALCRAAAVRCLIEGSEAVEVRHFTEELKEGRCGSSNMELVQLNEMWKPR